MPRRCVNTAGIHCDSVIATLSPARARIATVTTSYTVPKTTPKSGFTSADGCPSARGAAVGQIRDRAGSSLVPRSSFALGELSTVVYERGPQQVRGHEQAPQR